MEKWINVVETYPEPPSREDEFNRWYNKWHVPDAVDSPDYIGAVRYISLLPEIINGRGRYLAIYYMETDDIEKTMQMRLDKRLVEIKKGRGTDVCVNTWRDVLFRQIGKVAIKEGNDNIMGQWVNLVEMNCDPKREDEFLDWYLNRHLSELVKIPGILESRIYVQKEFRDGRGKYLTIYEIVSDDINSTVDLWEQLHKKAMDKDPSSMTCRPIWSKLICKKIFEYFPDQII
jgi:hypothetical protein